MRVRISEDELYPFYVVSKETYTGAKSYEVSDALLERYDKAVAELDAVFQELDAIFRK